MRIFVDTDLVVGHIGTQVISPMMLKEKMDERRAHYNAGFGIIT